MAIALLLEFPGAGQQLYDQIVQELKLGGRLAKGGIFHVSGPMDGGMRIVDVWESQEAFDTFQRDRLGPIAQKLGLAVPKVTVWPVHNMLMEKYQG